MSTVRRARLAGVLAVVVWLTCGCGLFGREDPTVAARPERSGPPEPTVLARGREPRRPLRLELTPGYVATVALTVDLAVEQRVVAASPDGPEEPTLGGSPDQASPARQVVDPPAMTQDIRFRVESVTGDHAELSFVIADAALDRSGTDLSDEELASLTASVQRMVGIGGRGRISNRGIVSDFAYDLPADLDRTLAAAMRDAQTQVQSLVIPLPVAPLGVGARWRSVSHTTLSGLAVRQTTLYRLTASSDAGIRYTADITQTADEQDLATTAGPPTRLLSSSVKGVSRGSLAHADLLSEFTSELAGSQLLAQDPDGDAHSGTEVEQTLEMQVSAAISRP